jgi:hypothetical protein
MNYVRNILMHKVLLSQSHQQQRRQREEEDRRRAVALTYDEFNDVKSTRKYVTTKEGG